MRRGLTAVLMIVAVSVASAQAPQPTPDGVEAIKADLERIKTDLEALKKQLGEVLRLVSQRPAQAAASGPVRTSVAGAPILGRADAPVTIVEFSDYQCPFCQRFVTTTFPVLKKEYVDTGKVRYVFRDYPLDQLHPQ